MKHRHGPVTSLLKVNWFLKSVVGDELHFVLLIVAFCLVVVVLGVFVVVCFVCVFNGFCCFLCCFVLFFVFVFSFQGRQEQKRVHTSLELCQPGEKYCDGIGTPPVMVMDNQD